MKLFYERVYLTRFNPNLLNESAKYIRGYLNTYIKVYVRRLRTGGVRGVKPKVLPVSRDSGK